MMIQKTPNDVTQEGDLAQLVSPSKKLFFVRLTTGEQLHTHRGVVDHQELIGLPWGSEVFTHTGSAFLLLQPSLNDLLKETKRTTQIMYPKDIGFILLNMSIGPGIHVVEAGSGSGALTIALAWAVGSQGHVTSYEIRPEVQRLAQKNLERVGLADRVTLKVQDIGAGFDERSVDALFLDLPNPYDYLVQVKQALKPGGFFGAILPTTNQVIDLLTALRRADFAYVDVCEIFLRYHKPIDTRFRPSDRMVAHTGYLIFARSITSGQERQQSPQALLNDQRHTPQKNNLEVE